MVALGSLHSWPSVSAGSPWIQATLDWKYLEGKNARKFPDQNLDLLLTELFNLAGIPAVVSRHAAGASLPQVDVGSSVSSTVSSSGICFVACELHNLAYNDYICAECVQISFLGILCTVQHNNYIVLSYINYCKLFMPGIFHLIYVLILTDIF